MRARHNVYRDGRVHVCREMCSTCIFRPGNLMQLKAGRVRQMVDEAKANDSVIVCHQTLDSDNAACRGYVDRHQPIPVRLAWTLGIVVEVIP